MATMPERIKALETTQRLQEEEHEKLMMNLSVRVDEAHAMAQEAKNMAVETNGTLKGMPDEVVKRIKAESKAKHLEFRDWLFLLVAVGTMVAAFWKL